MCRPQSRVNELLPTGSHADSLLALKRVWKLLEIDMRVTDWLGIPVPSSFPHVRKVPVVARGDGCINGVLRLNF
jgi:hypothetical protein